MSFFATKIDIYLASRHYLPSSKSLSTLSACNNCEESSIWTNYNIHRCVWVCMCVCLL